MAQIIRYMIYLSCIHTAIFFCVSSDEDNGIIKVPENLSDYGRVWMRASAVIKHSQSTIVKINGSDHPDQNTDLAVLKLKGKIEYGHYAQPIAIPDAEDDYRPVFRDEYIVLGWGSTTG